MVKIDSLTLIDQKFVVVKGWALTGQKLNESDSYLICGELKLSARIAVRSMRHDVLHHYAIPAHERVGFVLLFEIRRGVTISETHHCVQVFGQKLKSETFFQNDIESYLDRVYSDNILFKSLPPCFIAKLLTILNDENFRVLHVTNNHDRSYAMVYLDGAFCGSVKLYLANVKKNNIECSDNHIITVPAHRSTYKEVYETTNVTSSMLILYSRAAAKVHINYKFLRLFTAIALIAKKLNRKPLANFKINKLRFINYCVRLYLPSKRSDIIHEYRNRVKTVHRRCSYAKYIATIEPTIESRILGALVEYSTRNQPLISVITPLYNTPINFFKELLESMLAQTYCNWEWVLVDDFSSKREVVFYIESILPSEPRIKLIKSNENRHISKTTNIGINNAQGQLIAFCDHDDRLHKVALSAVILSYHTHPEAEWFYSDEDFISVDGFRHSPHLKSAFNPELLKTHNYITHFSVVKKATLDRIGYLDSKFDGAQDYELHLRLASNLPACNIIHIPLVLYHWRQAEGSTAKSSDAKGYTHAATLDAAKKTCENLALLSVREISGARPNYVRIDNPKSDVLVSIIIPFKDHVDLLRACIDSINRTCIKGSYEIILVNNGSTLRETMDYLNGFACNDDVKILNDGGNFNFSRLINSGAYLAKGECLILLNNDIEALNKGWLEELRDLAMYEFNGCVGCKLFYPDGTIQHAGVGLGLGGYAAHFYRSSDASHPGNFGKMLGRFNVLAVTAAALAVRKELFDRVGGFDEHYPVAYNDVDFNLKLFEAGYWNICTNHVTMLHHESKSRGDDLSPENTARFEMEKKRLATKWKKYLADDPFYNPLLTRTREDCSFADTHEWRVCNSLIAGRKLHNTNHSLSKKG